MAAYSNAQLETMGLEPQRDRVDKKPTFSDWARKLALHTAIKAQTQDDKLALDELWRTAKGNSVVSSVYCNMGIYIIKIQAVVTGGGAGGTDKPLPDEFYLCKEEMGIWTVKYLTASEGPHKQNAHLKQAS